MGVNHPFYPQEEGENGNQCKVGSHSHFHAQGIGGHIKKVENKLCHRQKDFYSHMVFHCPADKVEHQGHHLSCISRQEDIVSPPVYMDIRGAWKAFWK